MPLNDAIPRIDNRRYDDLLAEVRTRIPRYTPEWTDLNDNDPGIALVQVFAWMTDQLIYRLGKVPELNYIKFLQLVGIELRPASPARAEVTFPVVDGHTEPYVHVPARTQLAAESDEGEQLIFETERALVALTAQLAAVQAFDGYSYTLLTTANEEAEGAFAPFGPLANPGSALLLGFDYDDLFPDRVELNLAVWVPEPSSGAGAVACGLPETQTYVSVQVTWEYWSGSEWRPATLLKDETRALTQSGHVYLKTPEKGAMQRVVIGEAAESLYWIRGRVSSGAYERPPTLQAVRTNTVGTIQAETIREEVLGGSNGRPNQVFQLDNAPVLDGTLVLEVDEGEGYQAWEQVSDFFGSAADDPHFVLNRTTGEIEFGDGEHGRIPVANVENPAANVLAREYRHGGGSGGNVAAGSLTSLLTSVVGIDSGGITNLTAAAGGRDEETLEEAKDRAPRTLRSKCRAVSSEDFETLAVEAGVRRAKALPLHHPSFPGVPIPGVVTVIVVPDTGAPNPMPSPGTLRTVCAYLDMRRLLTTEVYVVPPTYHQVEIRGDVVALNDADLGEVKEGIEQALLAFFHPLTGGEDGLGWPFGGDIYFSQVYQRVFNVAGVGRIERLVIVLDGEEYDECRNVPIAAGALIYSTAHDVAVNYDFEL